MGWVDGPLIINSISTSGDNQSIFKKQNSDQNINGHYCRIQSEKLYTPNQHS